jgi:hypothetical protein
MHMFIEKFSCEKAIKISQAPFKSGIPIFSIPLYAIESLIKKPQ